MMIGRYFSKTFGQTMALATPVSSSIVMKITPLAEPGRWRTSTSPATVTLRPTGAVARARLSTSPCPESAARRKETGCAFSEKER
ncbi:hypothetical protein D3C78_1486290 [compost metagenome]